MIPRILNAYLVECLKAMRAKSTYLGPVLAVLLSMLAPLIHPITDDSGSAYAFIAFTTPMVLNLLGLLLVLTFCAGLVSSEMGSGTIRLVLVRPLLRHEFLLAKLLLGMTYAALLTLLVGVSTWTVAAIQGRLAGVVFGGEMLHTSSEMLKAYVLGALLGLAPQFAAAAFAVMVSTLARSTGAAVGAAVGVWIVCDTLKYPLRIAPFLFSTYMESPWQVFTTYCEGLESSWTPSLYYCLASSLGAIVVFTAVAVVSFNRRNIQA
ncbi:MAG: ABC transporter permease subunit [Candidatus Hydrogenedentes bacterium]|nr:ABC transporter permease subunit [Candidatus Hydrogenedentota bacterium]